ncbi:MAG: 16S rRNA processing protein RimM [Bacteroidetes bacterium]|nr:16S rRNA processing protein RimM [Bacteroidota bacterium]
MPSADDTGAMDFVAIGKILKPVGTRGAMKIQSLTDVPGRFEKLRSVWIGTSADSVAEYSVSSVRICADTIVLSVDAINSIEDVDGVRNALVFIRQEERIPLQDGSYYIDAIIGCSVYDECGSYIGKVTDVFTLTANDIWLVSTENGTVMVPAVKLFIREVDVGMKRIIIHVVDGLLE